MADLGAVIKALAVQEPQPRTAFAALAVLAAELVGAKLFTVMSFERKTRLARRMYSNMPDAYPVSGTKPIEDNDWTAQVLDRGEVFSANDIEGIAEVFDDHELIRSLGCESVLNVPLVVAGETLGSLNCLDRKGRYYNYETNMISTLSIAGLACMQLAISKENSK